MDRDFTPQVAAQIPDLVGRRYVDAGIACMDLQGGRLTPAREVTLACTRHKDHSGRHAAGDGQIILATWRS